MANADVVLSLEQAKSSLSATLGGLRSNSGALEAARVNAAGDTIKLLETVGPLMAEVQFPIISPFGYTTDDDGLMHYTSAVRTHADDHEDVAALMASIHMIVLVGEAEGVEGVPKLTLEPTTVTYEEVLLSARGSKPAV
uniref:Protein C10 n=1 Tax=Haptolina brevifila TaxID=156173 RepID=A0A7S2IXJ5_9EUKA|mmetsp:Transcript_7239/g.14800  ORF Transcript_7239/g.14800 Transcript_7239/m.14800 type:complete len:139 (+) Transcript_7239:34-450(+)|eukprot:CAMPEP_0174717274 /NCGR_PEP_ID=MMETSP1094-20130205/26345_1 /TAXON_ID=156173 /ORGANISM="Chrysochromulina brevifilum, Strain UTEX LB 985" /LENGTH=138 /DNA_ID=CAMNT_0015917187 /DNA_START=32 /DNA_END=448 /DNA_ORIENTATION=-